MGSNPYNVGGDTGDGVASPDVSSHVTGNPISSGVGGSVTIGHTAVIVVGALLLLWLLGFSFKKIRM